MKSPPSRLDRLTVARDALAAAIAECDSKRDLPSLVREYRATMAEVDELGKVEAKVSDPIDDLASRRTARGGATARPRRAAAKPG